MKKITLAAIIVVTLSAGLTLQSKAQTKTANIEALSITSVKTIADIKSTSVYNKNGKLLYTVKRYEAAALPGNVRRMVSNQFYDFDIAGVEEVILPYRPWCFCNRKRAGLRRYQSGIALFRKKRKQVI